MDVPTNKSAKWQNLDLACAQAGQQLIEKTDNDIEKLITSALGVLEEQGVYAMFLYLKARGGIDGSVVIQNLTEFLKIAPRENPLIPKGKGGDILRAIRESWAEDLDRLLFARDLLRQTLVYARYHAKAREKSPQSRTTEEAS